MGKYPKYMQIKPKTWLLLEWIFNPCSEETPFARWGSIGVCNPLCKVPEWFWLHIHTCMYQKFAEMLCFYVCVTRPSTSRHELPYVIMPAEQRWSEIMPCRCTHILTLVRHYEGKRFRVCIIKLTMKTWEHVITAAILQLCVVLLSLPRSSEAVVSAHSGRRTAFHPATAQLSLLLALLSPQRGWHPRFWWSSEALIWAGGFWGRPHMNDPAGRIGAASKGLHREKTWQLKQSRGKCCTILLSILSGSSSALPQFLFSSMSMLGLIIHWLTLQWGLTECMQ